jgi:glycyl-tRNA synthetase beta chain
MSQSNQKNDFLFELGCEELPAKALPKLATSLHDHLKDFFESNHLAFADSEWFATPRRLAVRFSQLDTAQQDKQVEKLGPAVAAAFDADGNAKPAAMGFAKSNGVTVDQLSRKQTDKGERLAFVADVKGEQTIDLLPNAIEKAVAQLPVPKAMRWGDSSCQFSRPVHWLMALLGDKIISLNLFELTASNTTFGHRFHAPQAITINQPSEYDQKLLDASVIASFAARKANIRIEIEAMAKQNNATAIIDEDLLEEVAALVEWPVPLLGNFDTEFLQVPAEALVSSMAEHQKYFHLVDSNNQLLPLFITIANIKSSNPSAVVEGNEKVIRPRLADAKFFYDTDNKQKLSDNLDKLKTVVFQNKLGTLFDKSQRIKSLAKVIANLLDYDQQLAERAAELCKCDLLTNMVYEFPDLQGVMGRYYAINDGEPSEVAAAMDEIYMPRFSGDQLPSTQTGLVLALAERLDSLVGIFGIGQIPTGAKDPFALRRAAVGVLRLISEKQLNLDLCQLIDATMQSFTGIKLEKDTKAKLLDYFNARATAIYQEMDIATQVIKSVQELNVTKPFDFRNRVLAVANFNKTAESADLAEANKRVKNILAKSDFNPFDIDIDQSLFEVNETELFNTMNGVKGYVDQQVAQGEYQLALDKLASLKDVVNRFFDNVMINVDDIKVRNNRLALIAELRSLFLGIADISLLQK